MCKSFLGLCARLLLLSLPASMAWSAVPGVAPGPQGTALPFFQISSMSADDTGGVYNGSMVTLKIVVRNAGSGSGQWQATLATPGGYDFVDPNPCGGDLYSSIGRPAGPKSLNGTYLVWPHGTDGNGSGDTLAAGTTSTCNVRLNVVTATGNDIATATVYSGPYNNGSGSMHDTRTYLFHTTSSPTTDMAIAINASSSTVAVGSTVDYTLTATNQGRQTGTNVRTVFNFPNTLSVVPKVCPGASTLGGQSITWNAGNMNYASNATCVLTGTAQSGAGTNATVDATISANTADPVASNNTANNTVVLGLPQQADMAVSISANATSITPGQNVIYTLKASNLGPATATSIQVAAGFSTQLQLNSASCFTGAPANPFVWTVSSIMAGGSASCTVQATLSATTTATSITANDSVSSAVADGNTSNNSANVTLAVQQQAQAANIAIHLSGVGAAQSFTPGQILNLVVTATDTSSAADASGVVATVHLPNDGSLTGISAPCGTVDASGKLVWSIGSLLRSSSMTCTVRATVATATKPIAISADIDAAALGVNLDQLMDALVVPVHANPKQLSASISGNPTTQNSTHMKLNGDGSVAVFQSQQTDIVGGNVNANGQDIYRVGSNGQATLETVDSSGHQLIGSSSLPAISADGGVVAFAYGTNTAGSNTAVQAKDVITTSMWGGGSGQPKHQVDTGTGGAAPNGAVSGAPSVSSSNGPKKLVFCSAASNLVAGDGNGQRDIFLVDPTNPGQATQLVSRDSGGVQLPGDSCEPSISVDGTQVVFTTSAPSLYGTPMRQVVRKDLTTGALDLISVSTAGPGHGANADSSEPAISADGSVVAFTSQASNLDALGTPAGGHEAFVSLTQSSADGAARTLKRLRNGDGTVPNGASEHPQLSADGSIAVMQTAATNFFGQEKALTTPACGAVAITTNFFSPAVMASNLCGGSASNQNPTISGDGTTAGVDSNAPQAGTASTNSNAYSDGVGGLNSLGVSNLSSDFSGQWFDPNQSGQGLVIDVAQPDANNTRYMSAIWFVYLNGQPTWVLGAAIPKAGTGNQAGKVVVQMDQVAIFQGVSFPIGENNAAATLWGSITLTFTDANTGTMSWTSTYPGFNSGTMLITHFQPVSAPASDPPGAQIKACYSGNWKEPTKSGHGFEFEVTSSSAAGTPVLAVDWFTFSPTGAPVWLYGGGVISGNSVQMPLLIINGTGAQFPPRFSPSQITQNLWGTATFTFSDATHAHVTWNSTVPGYGQGQLDLVPTYGLDRRACH
jgi:uncharacterized repeat protein (TIGR01451 family)